MIRFACTSNPNVDIGQWIRFSKETINGSSEKEGTIYAKDHYFLVIVRENELSDPGRCLLIDLAGKIYDYCPCHSFLLSSSGEVASLAQSTIELLPREEVLHILRQKNVQATEKIAKERAEELANYFKKSPTARIFGISPMHQSKL